MTKITLQKNGQDWVFFNEDDEEELLKISKEEYMKLCLYNNDYYTEEEFGEIKNKVMRIRGRKYALQTNIYNNKSLNQIYEKLIYKGIDDKIAYEVINKMKEDGEINEYDVIKRFIRDRLKFHPRSKKYIKYELIKKGFISEDVEYVIEEMCLFDIDIAKDILKRKRKQIKSVNDGIKLLKNKGFDYSTIKTVIKEQYHN